MTRGWKYWTSLLATSIIIVLVMKATGLLP